MLPDIENLDNLILNFEEEKNLKTKTFGITEKLSSSYTNDSAALGSGMVGKIVLNSTNTTVGTAIISRTIDGLEAVKQAIYFILSIEADQYIIYPYTYGIRTIDLFGKPIYYVMAVIPERIKEALFRDDRITDVSDFEFKVNGNKLAVKFIVHTIYGNIEEEMVVQY